MSSQIIILFVVFISLFCNSQQEECTQVLECSWWQSIFEGCPKPFPCITTTEISEQSEETTTEYVETTTTEPTTSTTKPTTTETAATTLLIETPLTVESQTTTRYNGSDSNLDEHMKCYQCSSTQKGCTSDWRKLTFLTCPLRDDKCVKIIHTHGNDDVIMRNCLSLVAGAPDDNSKGCRTVVRNESLDYNDNNDNTNTTNMGNVTWCFCQRDFCNDSAKPVVFLNLSSMIVLIIFFFVSI